LVTAHRQHLTSSFDRHAALWSAVDRLVDRAPNLEDLSAHGLHLFAARRWRLLGRELPAELADLERRAGAVVLAATIALERAREAYDGTMLLMKGLEVAERYQDPVLRPLRDLDLLVDRPDDAQRALIDAGFEPVGNEDEYYADRHHLRPLHQPGLPVLVEIHRRPQWVSWAGPPSAAELFSEAVPSETGVDGVLAPAPAHHALLIAAHSWSGAPLRRLLDLVDVTVLAETADQAELWEAARRWEVDGVWKTTAAAADAVLFGGPALPWHVRLWAGDLFNVRERTVLSNHVRRVASAFSALPPTRALPVSVRAIGRAISPSADESWPEKLRRASRAARNAFRSVSSHSGGRHGER
jgi:hypothetical protein